MELGEGALGFQLYLHPHMDQLALFWAMLNQRFYMQLDLLPALLLSIGSTLHCWISKCYWLCHWCLLLCWVITRLCFWFCLLRALSPQLVLLRMLGCTEWICAYSMLVGMVELLLWDQLLDRYRLMHQWLSRQVQAKSNWVKISCDLYWWICWSWIDFCCWWFFLLYPNKEDRFFYCLYILVNDYNNSHLPLN